MIDAISKTLAEPNLAFALFVAGSLAILYEVFKPGSIFPGVAGGAMVVGAILAARVLPVRPVAVFGIVAGLALLAVEVYTRSRGVSALLGQVALVTSGLHFIDLTGRPASLIDTALTQPVSLVVVIAVALVTAAVVLIVGRRIVKHDAEQQPGESIDLIGRQGEWVGDGLVSVSGALWRAASPTPIARGSRVLITNARGFALDVLPLNEEP